MASGNRIVVGCRVQARIGPFVRDERILSSHSPGVDVEEPSNKKARAVRRSRTVFHGTVVSSVPAQQWRVYWDEIGKTSDHTHGNLKVLSTSTVEDSDPALLSSWKANESIYIGDHQTMLLHTKDLKISEFNSDANIVSVIANREPEVSSPPPPLQPPSNVTMDTSTETTTTTQENVPNLPPLENYDDSDDEDDEDQNLIDEKELQKQFRAEEKTNKYLAMKYTYMSDKAELIHSEKTVDVKGPGQTVTTWTVVGDVKKSDSPQRVEYHETRGICGFDFKTCKQVREGGNNKRINLHELFMHLWGDDDDDVKIMENMNKYAKLNRAKSNPRHLPVAVKPFTRKEFWVGWGLVLAARVFHEKSGGNMWKKKKDNGEKSLTNLVPSFDPRPFMSEKRFAQWKSAVAWCYADDTLKDEDPWWQIIGLINSWNANRSRTLYSSSVTVLDESMSAFRPQTTATGNLPHLSFIQRKPEPLGTELKVTMCTELMMMKHLYLCRKKDDKTIVSKYASLSKKKTALVSLDLMDLSKVNRSSNDEPAASNDVFLGDAWFSSIDLAILTKIQHNANYIGVVKTNHSRFPKKFLEDTMSGWPGGSYMNMTATVDGVKLYATGYKYCNRKALMFLWTDGAGHTEPGLPYEATWIDGNGNRSVRFIERPSVIATYFERSNKIDVSNQMRQFELKLEKTWKTNCGFFRLLTTLIGCNVVDCWRGYRHHCRPQHRHKYIDLMDFTSLLAYDMLHNEANDGSGDVYLNINAHVKHIQTSTPSTSSLSTASSTPQSISPSSTSAHASNTSSSTSNNTSIAGHQILDGFAEFCLNRELMMEDMRKRHELVLTTEREKDKSTISGMRLCRAVCIAPGCTRKTSKYCMECNSGNRSHFWVCKYHEAWHTQQHKTQLTFKHR
jgi:hypothetical protein